MVLVERACFHGTSSRIYFLNLYPNQNWWPNSSLFKWLKKLCFDFIKSLKKRTCILPKIILLFAIENGIEIDSVMLMLRSGLFAATLTCGFAVLLLGALGTHSKRFDIIRL